MKTKMNVIYGDITKAEGYDVIVNSTNEKLVPGLFGWWKKSVNYSIHKKAGKGLARECKEKGSCEQGNAVITDAYGLSCKRVIHAVGPVWQEDGTEQFRLENCYFNVLDLARQEGLRKIAFSAISTGNHHYPKDKAAEIAVSSVDRYCMEYPEAFDEITFFFLPNDKNNYTQYELYLREYHRRETEYASLSFKIASYDQQSVWNILNAYVEEALKEKSVLRKLVRGLLGKMGEKTPEEALLFIIRYKQLCDGVLKWLNANVLESFGVQIKDVFLRRSDDGTLSGIVDLDKFEVDRLAELISEQMELKYKELLLGSLKVIMGTVQPEILKKVIGNIVNEMNETIADILMEFVQKKFKFEIEISDIQLLN